MKLQSCTLDQSNFSILRRVLINFDCYPEKTSAFTLMSLNFSLFSAPLRNLWKLVNKWILEGARDGEEWTDVSCWVIQDLNQLRIDAAENADARGQCKLICFCLPARHLLQLIHLFAISPRCRLISNLLVHRLMERTVAGTIIHTASEFSFRRNYFSATYQSDSRSRRAVHQNITSHQKPPFSRCHSAGAARRRASFGLGLTPEQLAAAISRSGVACNLVGFRADKMRQLNLFYALNGLFSKMKRYPYFYSLPSFRLHGVLSVSKVLKIENS